MPPHAPVTVRPLSVYNINAFAVELARDSPLLQPKQLLCWYAVGLLHVVLLEPTGRVRERLFHSDVLVQDLSSLVYVTA
jgi:hypothetical protein